MAIAVSASRSSVSVGFGPRLAAGRPSHKKSVVAFIFCLTLPEFCVYLTQYPLETVYEEETEVAATQIYVNLPVADIAVSKAFYEGLGFSLNPQFSDEETACVVFGENIFAMIMSHERFKSFTPKSDIATSGIEVINALGLESREEVDRVADTALSRGGSETRSTQDMGWMYNRGFADPDGHNWEAVYVDEVAMNEAFAETADATS